MGRNRKNSRNYCLACPSDGLTVAFQNTCTRNFYWKSVLKCQRHPPRVYVLGMQIYLLTHFVIINCLLSWLTSICFCFQVSIRVFRIRVKTEGNVWRLYMGIPTASKYDLRRACSIISCWRQITDWVYVHIFNEKFDEIKRICVHEKRNSRKYIIKILIILKIFYRIFESFCHHKIYQEIRKFSQKFDLEYANAILESLIFILFRI